MKLLRGILVLFLLLAMTVVASAQEGKVQLRWSNAEDAVMYELEIATVPVSIAQRAANTETIYRTTNIYTAGVELDLQNLGGRELNKLYYRARPLDLDGNPIGRFSRPEKLSKGTLNPIKPTPTAYFKNRPTPLYPVYAWIPVLNAVQYEVEITHKMPENPNGTMPSQYRVRSYTVGQVFDCYDTHAYSEAGTYYWRVIAIDANGEFIGGYSDAIPFKIETGNYKWAVLGDSITHGGGAISNPPSDERFDYSSYLPFPVKNLGRSGDTAAAIAERFESDVLPFKPKYMFILAGSNSIRGGTSADDVIESLQSIKQKCEDHGITAIFLTLPPINPERIERVFNQESAKYWQQELGKVNEFIRRQPYFVDIYPRLADREGLLPVKYAQDGLHPDISGKRVIGREIQMALKKYRFK